jgi:hypothetical protein
MTCATLTSDMTVTNDSKISQQDFLHDAMKRLNMKPKDLCKRISVPKKTFDKWLAAEGTADERAMPEMAWAYIREILQNHENSP